MFIFYFLVFVRWDDLERVRLVFREVEVLLVMPHRAAVMAAAAAEDMPVNMPVNLEPRLKGLCPNGLCWRKVSSNSLERLKVHWLMPWLVFIYCSAHQLAHSRIWHIIPCGNVFFRFFIKNFKFILIFFWNMYTADWTRVVHWRVCLDFFFTLDENGSDKVHAEWIFC